VIRILGIVEESCHATIGLEEISPLSVRRENDINDTSDSSRAVMQRLSFGPKINSGADDAAAPSLKLQKRSLLSNS
jgi:hypothetical protein